ncbi:MAG: TonB-dependent copper receptor [Halopseudomonas yangmingensis]|uniref:Iron complex outermembrane recepter protein n=1 Tax=Halopseudomonas yangmingensis TaxID=1720063 RepID=A0A1I4QSM0_9GAMM|nr:TonB-dependent copper receptor [Halopseudomonas yangmingensis]SFM42735.1 iron complex outermembrane recepter protein [Halopseudomonas yangmingensis]
MNQPNLARSLLAVALAGLTAHAAAQTAGHQQHAQSAENAQALELAPRVITGVEQSSPLRFETDPRLPRQPIPASDAGDYLKTIPGFSAIRGGGTNNDPVLRGMFGSRLKLLGNGGEMLGACPSRMDSPSSYIAPETYDRLQVIKGPQTVLWGPGASAGVILFERSPENFEEPGTRLNASATAASNTRRDLLVDGAAGNRQGYLRLGANRTRSDDYRDGNGDRVHSSWSKWNADVALGWTPDDQTLLELTAGGGDAEAAYAGRGMDGSMFKRESLGLRFKRDLDMGALQAIQAQLYYNYADHVMDNFTLRTPDTSSPMMMMRNPMATNVDRRTLGARLQSDWRWSDWQLQAGADAQRNEHRRRSSRFSMMTGYTDYNVFPAVTDAEFRQYGLFAELTHDQGQGERWISGLRVDRASATDRRARLSNPNMISWDNPSADKTRASNLPGGFLRYEQDLEAVSWYAGIGHSQRFPDYWELFSPSVGPAPGAVVQAFETADPERTTQLDVGLEYRQGDFKGWLSAYAGRIDDYLLFNYQRMPSGHIFTSVENVDARIMGAELGGNYRLNGNWSTESSLAWAWGKNRSDGQALPQMPPLEARFSLNYQQADWSAGLLLRGVARQTRVAENRGNVVGRDLGDSSGFATLALNAAWQVSPQARLSAGVDNLFDRAYSEHLNMSGNAGLGFPADPVRFNEPGRTLWTKLDLSF